MAGGTGAGVVTVRARSPDGRLCSVEVRETDLPPVDAFDRVVENALGGLPWLHPSVLELIEKHVREGLIHFEVQQLALAELIARGEARLHPDSPDPQSAAAMHRQDVANALAQEGLQLHMHLLEEHNLQEHVPEHQSWPQEVPSCQ